MNPKKFTHSFALAANFLRMKESDDTHIHDAEKLIKQDAVVTSLVLKECNQVCITNPTLQLSKAIQILGMNEVMKIILHKAMQDISNSNQPQEKNREIIKHSIITACMMEQIARLQNRSAGEAYITGLLHCISLLIMDNENWFKIYNEKKNSNFVKNHILNYSTTSAELLNHWNFPRKMIHTIELHQNLKQKEDVDALYLGCSSLISWNQLLSGSHEFKIPEVVTETSGLGTEFWNLCYSSALKSIL